MCSKVRQVGSSGCERSPRFLDRVEGASWAQERLSGVEGGRGGGEGEEVLGQAGHHQRSWSLVDVWSRSNKCKKHDEEGLTKHCGDDRLESARKAAQSPSFKPSFSGAGYSLNSWASLELDPDIHPSTVACLHYSNTRWACC